MIKRVIFLLISGVLILLSSCRKQTDVTQIQDKYTDLDPRSVPIAMRLKEYEKGNLIINPSFEHGRHYLIDTVKLSFNLNGWKKVGENVFWTNIQNSEEYENTDASNGIHAIKIVRNNVNETDTQGEGIITDYIRVIPGNYRLSMDIKLQHVESNMNRLISSIYDAVNIRLFFYDRNKVMIQSKAYNPLSDNYIDNTFKGQPFSNFSYINDLQWCRLIARSGDFPFEEGNIPVDTRYVKVFVGLKGKGEMWVDMVDFSYTTDNFTFYELMKPYMDSVMNRSEYLLPSPQHITGPQEMQISGEGEDIYGNSPVFLIPQGIDSHTRQYLNEFIDRLREKRIFLKDEDPLITSLSSSVLESERLIFSFGNTELYSQYSNQLPREKIEEKEQSYFILNIESLENVVFISYKDTEGLLYSLNTLDQLIDTSENIYFHYNIIDYPDIKKRASIIPFNINQDEFLPAEKSLEILARKSLNQFILEPRHELLNMQNFIRFSYGLKDQFNKFNRKYLHSNTGWSLLDLKFNSLSEFSAENDNLGLPDYRNVVRLEANKYSHLLNEITDQNTDLILFSDLNLWNSLDLGSLSKSMRISGEKEFDQYLQLRNNFWSYVKRNSLQKDFRTYLYPIINNNRIKNQFNGFDYYYFQGLDEGEIFDNILWSGPVHYSKIVDYPNYFYFSDNLDRPVTYFDNSLKYREDEIVLRGYSSIYPGKSATSSLFEPFHVEFGGLYEELLINQMIFNLNDFSELTFLRLLTAVDFMWNKDDYDPYKSIWKTLVTNYGIEIAEQLILFNDLIYQLVSVTRQIELGGANSKFMKTGDELKNQIDHHWDMISQDLSNNIDLLNSLSDFKNRVISRFMKITGQPQTID